VSHTLPEDNQYLIRLLSFFQFNISGEERGESRKNSWGSFSISHCCFNSL